MLMWGLNLTRILIIRILKKKIFFTGNRKTNSMATVNGTSVWGFKFYPSLTRKNTFLCFFLFFLRKTLL